MKLNRKNISIILINNKLLNEQQDDKIFVNKQTNKKKERRYLTFELLCWDSFF